MVAVRCEVFFSGNVQGVGFRYTAVQISKSFNILGTVENLPDRRVKMVLEGEADTINQFIDEVCESTHGNVTETEILRHPATGEFSEFCVVR